MKSLREMLDEILARIDQVEELIGNALEPDEENGHDDSQED